MRATRRAALSRQRLVDEPLALLEDPSGGELSMRRLAQRLGVAPNALYTHVRDKADLVAALGDEVYDDSNSQMTYDLRRLRLHGLIQRIPHTNT